jgi:small subunit ribosomal protein S18
MPPAARAKKRDDFYRDRRRRKVCAFCADKTVQIDYKEVNRLRRYLSERAKIEPRRKTGTCAPRRLTVWVGPAGLAPPCW